jgi:hypothetical protein
MHIAAKEMRNLNTRAVQISLIVEVQRGSIPILLTAKALREKLVDHTEATRHGPMVRKALSFIVKHGPATEQDRWEEVGGYSSYSIAALLEGAELTPEPGYRELLARNGGRLEREHRTLDLRD